MSETTGNENTKTFARLLVECGRVVVPQIQRDYAQGRESTREVRESFLNALHAALSLRPEDERLPLNLDFIYGSMEGGDRRTFLPLDGQQRLTTLFLLHWYLAWQDKQLVHFQNLVRGNQHSRFSYQVRPSSEEFFDALVAFAPTANASDEPSIKWVLEDQPWFFLSWRLDPTIQSCLTMLDAIHERFRTTTGLYARLVDDTRPVITFQLLQLEHFGLTDDLYIKMNARGKPLTAFETFKARFEEHLKTLYSNEYRQLNGEKITLPMFFATRMDSRWTHFFWSHKDPTSDTFDDAVMNLVYALVRISVDPVSSSFTQDMMRLRTRNVAVTFTGFHDPGWLNRRFADSLICLLEAWSPGAGGFVQQLPTARCFDEIAFFRNAIKAPWAIDYAELVLFAAFISYLQENGAGVKSDDMQEWIRVLFNLSMNSGIDRPEDFGRALSGVQALLPYSRNVLENLATKEIAGSGFSGQQVREEVTKAQLIRADAQWRARIDAAEQHSYFRGQIEFLLEFAGVKRHATEDPISDWPADVHAELQARFDDYLAKARAMFGAGGLQDIPGKSYLWERALLVFGDYLPTNNKNYSFLTNPIGNWDSWKRYLRGQTTGPSPRREYLKALWDRLDAGGDIGTQMEEIVSSRSGVEPWREATVKHPEIMEYCGEHEIRKRENAEEIYLMKKKQMNGAHAELFSYALHLELATPASREMLAPLVMFPYHSVTSADKEPYVPLVCEAGDARISFEVFSTKGQFAIRAVVENHPNAEAMLRDKCGFADQNGILTTACARDKIHNTLHGIARTVASALK